MRQWSRGFGGVALALSVATACGSGAVGPGHSRAVDQPGTTTAGTPSSVFVARGIALPVMSVDPHQPPSYIRAVATVYQPSGSGDGTATPFLAAMFAPGEDCCSSFPGLLGPRVEPGFKRLQVHGRAGAIGKVGNVELVVWTTPPTSQEADEAAVLGVGVSDAELRRAAEGTSADEHNAKIAADALPAGYRAVASGPINVGPSALGGGFMVRYGNNTSYVQVETASGGAALFALARATTGGQSVDLGGHKAWSGPAVIDGLQVQRYLWRDGDDVVAVDAQGVAGDEVRRFIGSLRREPTPQALHDARQQIADYPAQQLAGQGEEVAVSLRVGGGLVAIKLDAAKGDKLLLEVAGVGLPPDMLGTTTGWPAAQSRASWDTLGSGQAVVFGSTPLPAASVSLRGPHGNVYRTTLGHAASHPELTFFAVVVPQNAEPPDYSVSARDDHGRILGKWTVT